MYLKVYISIHFVCTYIYEYTIHTYMHTHQQSKKVAINLIKSKGKWTWEDLEGENGKKK